MTPGSPKIPKFDHIFKEPFPGHQQQTHHVTTQHSQCTQPTTSKTPRGSADFGGAMHQRESTPDSPISQVSLE
jgi:hypothetical protein